MLEEAWHWLRIGSTGAATRLGYRREAAALRTRHRRCAPAWQSHLEGTRQALVTSARLACAPAPAMRTQATGEDDNGARSAHRGGVSRDSPPRIALLMGAGLLRDVPWRELLELYDEVVLADLTFHPEARAASRASGGRLRLETVDVTGCVHQLASDPGRIPDLRAQGRIPLDDLLDAATWVASVNLLTQIPLLPCAWLRSHGHNEEAIQAFEADLLAHHLMSLALGRGSACLVAELRDRVIDADGAVVDSASRERLLADTLDESQWHCLRRWQWQVNPAGEMSAGQIESRELIALHRAATVDGRVFASDDTQRRRPLATRQDLACQDLASATHPPGCPLTPARMR